MRAQLVEQFVAEEEGELGVTANEIVYILESDADGWTFVQNSKGESGLVPSAFLTLIQDEQDSELGSAEPLPEEVVQIFEAQAHAPVQITPPPVDMHNVIHLTPDEKHVHEGKRRSSISKKIGALVSPRDSHKQETAPSLDRSVSIDAALERSISPRQSSITSIHLKSGQPDIILRVYTNEDVYKELDEKELSNPDCLRTFKTIRVPRTCVVRYIIDEVAKKLLLPDYSKFHLFAVDHKATTLKLLREDEHPLQNEEDIKLALIFAPKVKVKALKTPAESRWQPVPGDLTHRRLLTDQFAKLADVNIILGNNMELFTFRAVVEIRFPALLTGGDDLIKKRKEKNKAHGVAVTLRYHDGLFSVEVFQSILDFMYTGRLDFVMLNQEQVVKIFQAAKRLQYPILADTCRAHIESNLGVHNVFTILKVSHDFQADELKQFAINFCFNNWISVSASKEGLAVIGLELFQEITILKAGMSETPPLAVPLKAPVNTVVEDFAKIRSLMHFADAVAVFGPQIIPFHRCILAGASPKLATMLLKDTGSTKKLPQYTFDISGNAFKGLLDLIYSGTTLMGNIPACELLDVMVVPFELPTVRLDCERLLCTPGTLNLENILIVLRTCYSKISEGRKLLTETLRNECLSFVCAHFRDLNVTELDAIHPRISFEVLEVMHARFNAHNIVGLAPL